MKRLSALFGLALLSAGSTLLAATYQIDGAHSTAGFTVRHMMVSNVSGAFNKVSGSVDYDPDNLARTSIDVTIEAASINTRNDGRDKDIRSANFLDVENYPTIKFQSKRVEQAGEGRLRVVGDLTLRGVTKEVVLDVEGPTPEIEQQKAFRRGASATTLINRKDFGVNYHRVMDNGGLVVSDEVRINIDVELVRRPAPASTSE